MLTVVVNDQAYLYAVQQSQQYEKEKGFAPDADVFLRWQDEWKEESNAMVHRLLEDSILEALAEDEDE
jgi:hypothetical protein